MLTRSQILQNFSPGEIYPLDVLIEFPCSICTDRWPRDSKCRMGRSDDGPPRWPQPWRVQADELWPINLIKRRKKKRREAKEDEDVMGVSEKRDGGLV